MIIRSRAPLRISFAGGGTDVYPYSDEKGGLVLSATIDWFAHTSFSPRNDRQIVLHSINYNSVSKITVDQLGVYKGKNIVKGTLKEIFKGKSFDLYLNNPAPPGSGLGGSSTLIVSLIGIYKELSQKMYTLYNLAELAYDIERNKLGYLGGKQDQYSAVFGGFNLIEFQKDKVIVNSLRIKDCVIKELNLNLMLCYVGKRKTKGSIIQKQLTEYQHKNRETITALDNSKKLAEKMTLHLLNGRIKDFGIALSEAWEEKKKFTPGITNLRINKIYNKAINSGALGGKILGAGGGGYLLLYTPFEKRSVVSKHVEKLGAKVVNFSFINDGLNTWKIK